MKFQRIASERRYARGIITALRLLYHNASFFASAISSFFIILRKKNRRTHYIVVVDVYKRQSVMLLEHIGEVERAALLERALDFCMFEDKKYVITGRPDGATSTQFTNYLMDVMRSLSE